MSYKKDLKVKQIISNLAFLSKSTSLENVIGLFDNNRNAQEFFMMLFNLVFGFELIDLDIENNEHNYPAIDLGDKKVGLAIQVTTDSSSSKIKNTLEKFERHELYKDYERIVFFIIGSKKEYSTTFTTNGEYEFNPTNDIWDDNYLIQKINSINDIKKIELICSFLEEYLVEFKFPEVLTQKDIKGCIGILKRDFGSVKSLQNLIERRDAKDFIKNKNIKNKISWNFFKEKIQGHIKYNKEINDFLSDPINKNLQKDYFDIAQAIQDFFHTQTEGLSFEDIFRNIFEKLNTYDDAISGIDIKMKILIHNMYFNCDIGDNP